MPGPRARRGADADRWTGVALVSAVVAALLLGLWIWPRATAWWPSGLTDAAQSALSGEPVATAVPTTRPFLVFATATAPPTPTLDSALIAPEPTITSIPTLESAPTPAVAPAAAIAPAAPGAPTESPPSPAPPMLSHGRLAEDTYLYADPGPSQPVASLRAGTLVLVHQQQIATDGQPWYFVRRAGGPEGWLPARLVVSWVPTPRTSGPFATSTPLPRPTLGTIAAGARGIVGTIGGATVPLRVAPADTAAPSAELPGGATVQVLALTIDDSGVAWAQVQGGGAEGWTPISTITPLA